MSPGKINNASTAKRLWRKARIARFAVRLAGTRVPRIAFIITGSRGDYQAYIPVAKLLKPARHPPRADLVHGRDECRLR